jgi:DNA polymerase-3 subunit beta
LQTVAGVVEKRQTMPILANALLVINNSQLSITCTDLEIELVATIALESASQDFSKMTIPARKLLDICRVLPENAILDFNQDNNNYIIVRSGHSRFVLATMPTDDFPNVEWETQNKILEFTIPQKKLSYLIESTHFAMAQQDVRYYLNGLLLEVKNGTLEAVASDGHRMAINSLNYQTINDSLLRIIVPRKGIAELLRSLEDSDEEIKIIISNNHIRIEKQGLIFTSKLIDSKYPDYEKIIPRSGNKTVIIDRNAFRQALIRVAILSEGMFCGVTLQIRSGFMRVFTRSQEHEEAEEEIIADYKGEDMTIGFNINYLLDILATVESEKVVMTLKDNSSSVLLEKFGKEGNKGNNLYVIMPLRINST